MGGGGVKRKGRVGGGGEGRGVGWRGLFHFDFNTKFCFMTSTSIKSVSEVLYVWLISFFVPLPINSKVEGSPRVG